MGQPSAINFFDSLLRYWNVFTKNDLILLIGSKLYGKPSVNGNFFDFFKLAKLFNYQVGEFRILAEKIYGKNSIIILIIKFIFLAFYNC